MSSLLQPLHLLLMMFAGWVNRHQLDASAIDLIGADYLRDENLAVDREKPLARAGAAHAKIFAVSDLHRMSRSEARAGFV